ADHKPEVRKPADRKPANPTLAALAERVRQVQRRHRIEFDRVVSDWPELNRSLGGGVVRGAIHELVAGAPAAPTWTLAMCLAAKALRAAPRGEPWHTNAEQAAAPAGPWPAVPCYADAPPGLYHDKWLIYVDLRRDFYPPAAAALGLPLDRLIVVRADSAQDVQWICQQALGCRAVAAVIAPLPRADAALSRRLQLAAETGGGIGLLLRDGGHGGHTFAASRLRLDPAPSTDGSRRA